MDFLDAVPAGSYVSVRLILDAPYSTFVSDWAADTALFGKGNSLYHRLKENGFTAIDSFTYPRTWAFVFKKGDASFVPAFQMSDGVYDRITLSVDCVTSNAEGQIVSPVFGPAMQWKNVNWNGYSQEDGNDKPVLHVYGVRNDNTDTLLYSIDHSVHSFDISAVDVREYPFVKLALINTDSVTATPYQLTDWSIDYAPVPEGAVAPNLYLAIPDTVSALKTGLHIGFAFKNTSKSNFDSLAVKVILTDSLNNQIVYPMYTLRPLSAGDTLHVDLPVDVSSLNGLYNLYVEVNPRGNQPEQYHFNNFLYKYVYIQNPTTLPVTLLDFTAVLQGSTVSTKWSVTEEVNTSRYEVQRSVNGIDFTTVGSVAASQGSERKSYSYSDLTPAEGKNYYRLKMYDSDGSYTFSAVQLITVAQASSIKIYPNPVKDILVINIARPDGKLSDVKLLSSGGQQLWHRKMNGNAEISMKRYASGTYVLQVGDGNTVKTYKIQKQ